MEGRTSVFPHRHGMMKARDFGKRGGSDSPTEAAALQSVNAAI